MSEDNTYRGPASPDSVCSGFVELALDDQLSTERLGALYALISIGRNSPELLDESVLCLQALVRGQPDTEISRAAGAVLVVYYWTHLERDSSLGALVDDQAFWVVAVERADGLVSRCETGVPRIAIAGTVLAIKDCVRLIKDGRTKTSLMDQVLEALLKTARSVIEAISQGISGLVDVDSKSTLRPEGALTLATFEMAGHQWSAEETAALLDFLVSKTEGVRWVGMFGATQTKPAEPPELTAEQHAGFLKCLASDKPGVRDDAMALVVWLGDKLGEKAAEYVPPILKSIGIQGRGFEPAFKALEAIGPSAYGTILAWLQSPPEKQVLRASSSFRFARLISTWKTEGGAASHLASALTYVYAASAGVILELLELVDRDHGESTGSADTAEVRRKVAATFCGYLIEIAGENGLEELFAGIRDSFRDWEGDVRRRKAAGSSPSAQTVDQQRVEALSSCLLALLDAKGDNAGRKLWFDLTSTLLSEGDYQKAWQEGMALAILTAIEASELERFFTLLLYHRQPEIRVLCIKAMERFPGSFDTHRHSLRNAADAHGHQAEVMETAVALVPKLSKGRRRYARELMLQMAASSGLVPDLTIFADYPCDHTVA